MATTGRRRQKSSSMSSIPKKYRGDPDDPHFVPKSPILSRQILSAKEEEDLKRACQVALSGIPNSDESGNDDYLLQLARHITVQVPKEPRHQRQKSKDSQKSGTSAANINRAVQRSKSRNDDTATPSATSQRDRSVQSSSSTPMTSVVVTPADTSKRFFESTEKYPMSSRLSKQDKSRTTSQMAYAFLNEPAASPTIRMVPPASKSMTSLQINGRARTGVSESTISSVQSNTVALPMSPTYNDFNKSLPELPQPRMEASHTSIGIFDFGRSKGWKSNAKKGNEQVGKVADVQRAYTAPTELTTKKHKFSIMSLFNKRKRQTA